MKTALTYQFRAYAKPRVWRNIENALELTRELYNSARWERQQAWESEKQSVSLFDQNKWLVGLRMQENYASLASNLERGALIRIDNAFKAFFRRCKSGEAPGYPRYKTPERWNTLVDNDVYHATVKKTENGLKIKYKGMGRLLVKPNRPVPDSAPKTIRITRRGNKLYVSLVYEVETTELSKTGAIVGLDMGVTNTITTSDGQTINRRHRSDNKKKHLQRRIARQHKGSKRRKKRVAQLANECHKIAVSSRNESHRITSQLVKDYDVIAVEKLDIKKMLKKGGASRVLHRNISESAWGQIHNQLAYKAEWAGKVFVEVNPRYTSQDCHVCGTRNPLQKEYSVYECRACGLVTNRDHNAAINILRRGMAASRVGRWLDQPRYGQEDDIDLRPVETYA